MVGGLKQSRIHFAILGRNHQYLYINNGLDANNDVKGGNSENYWSTAVPLSSKVLFLVFQLIVWVQSHHFHQPHFQQQ